MSEYAGQELSIEQLFHALNAKILERTQLYRSSTPERDQEHWISYLRKQLCHTAANARLLENSLRPFHRLHPDIIVEISKYLDPRACNNGYRTLLYASQICRIWREAVVSQPSLWSLIDGSHPGLIPCLLDRSKNAQLDVYIVSYRVEEIVACINPHVNRLRSIKLDLTFDDASQLTTLRDLHAAPKLRRLEIGCEGTPVSGHLGFTPGVVEPIASLHHLQLVGFPITPQLAQLRTLTFVSLDVSLATLKAPLDLLSTNPFLKVIQLFGHAEVITRYPPGSINLPHLEVLLSESIPLVHLEALSPPYGARIFSGFPRGAIFDSHARGSYTATFPIPASFTNLRDLRKLRVMDQGEVYVKLEGDKGSVTYCMSHYRPFGAETYGGIPLREVTDATYEIYSPPWQQSQAKPSISQPRVSRIVCEMERLQKLELSCFGAEQVDYFLLVLHSTGVCRYLKFLVLSHCAELYRQTRGLATMAETRKAAGIGLDSVRIVHSNIEWIKLTFKREDMTRLEHAVGALEYVQVDQGQLGQSPLGFDPEIGITQPYMFF
ncbi:hypothetical protein BJ322DRAFT_1080771 [Thelephora terrestris]|uniref:F-box domain-containing protein n=1 Tax=Thelephora terrestris TaxID=56493 RepID=A0A9P6L3Q4_9AGAM|nr:hypothetical protein BJ322DRAFT_1080771 [Thelephora terrestris]